MTLHAAPPQAIHVMRPTLSGHFTTDGSGAHQGPPDDPTSAAVAAVLILITCISESSHGQRTDYPHDIDKDKEAATHIAVAFVTTRHRQCRKVPSHRYARHWQRISSPAPPEAAAAADAAATQTLKLPQQQLPLLLSLQSCSPRGRHVVAHAGRHRQVRKRGQQQSCQLLRSEHK